MPRAALDHPAGHFQPQSPQAARDQIGPSCVEAAFDQRRHAQHDLADVPRLLHPAEGGLGFAERPDPGGERLQLAAGHTLHQLAERATGVLLRRAGLQGQDVILDVGALGLHPLGRPDIALAQFHEPRPGGQRTKRGGNKPFAGEAVEDRVDTLSAGGFEDPVGKPRRARVEHVRHPQRSEVGLLGAAGGGEDVGPQGLRQLHGRQPHAAAGGMDEDPLPAAQPQSLDGQLGGDEGNGDRGPLDEADPRRQVGQQVRRDVEASGKRSRRQPHHAIADGKRLDALADGHHFASQFAAQGADLNRHHPQGVQHVAEVEARRVHPHLDLTGPRRRNLERLEVQARQRAVAARRQSVRAGLRPAQRVRGRGAAQQARHPAARQPQRDLVLLVGLQELVGQAVHAGFRGGGIQVHAPARQLRVFQGQHLAHPPQGRLRHRTAVLLRQRLSTPGDQPDACPRYLRMVHQRLHERQHAAATDFYVRRQRLPRGGLGGGGIQAPEMHHAAERRVVPAVPPSANAPSSRASSAPNLITPLAERFGPIAALDQQAMLIALRATAPPVVRPRLAGR